MFFGLEKTQQDVSVQLESLVNSGSFPSAVLFYGPECSSRMFASECVSKALGCDGDSTVIISDRNHLVRIRAALKLFRKSKNGSSKKFLKNTVSVFLMQYHGALLDSGSSSVKKKFSDASECMELIEQMDGLEEKNVESFCDKLEKAVSKLADSSKGLITVDQVRSIKDWCSTSSLEGKSKLIIIEGLENSSEGSSNALLKTLEETPSDTHFILISEDIGRIKATVLSRVRKFRFNPLSDSSVKMILNSLFVPSNDFKNLEDFFVTYSGVDDSLLKKSAREIVNGKETDLKALVSELESNQMWDRFFNHVIEELKLLFSEGGIKEWLCSYLVNELTDGINKGRTYNQNRRLTFDFVVFRLKEVLG